jgi:hypothetical protein
MAPTNEQFGALVRLFEQADGHTNSGALVIQRFLLGLYNGYRFPFDLTDFRRLDRGNFEACLQVLQMDFMPQCEVHVQMALALGKPQVFMSLVFERWGYDQRLKGRCKKEGLEGLKAALLQHNARARSAQGGAA